MEPFHHSSLKTDKESGLKSSTNELTSINKGFWTMALFKVLLHMYRGPGTQSGSFRPFYLTKRNCSFFIDIDMRITHYAY